MATDLKQLPLEISGQIKQPSQLVLEIDGVSTIFGIGQVKKYARIGDPELYINDLNDQWDDWVIGGLVPRSDQKNIISWEGTSDSISQRLEIDRGGTSSISNIQVALLDKDGYATDLITPSKIVDDILGRKATVYLGYQDTAWPQDFIQIFSGIIDKVEGGTTVILTISHPEAKKRGECFTKITTELTKELNFRSKVIQGILFKTRRDVVGTVDVTYIGGGTFDAESVAVSGNHIVVSIQLGATRAKNIRNAIERSVAALALVSVQIQEDEFGESLSEQLQNAQPLTELTSDLEIEVKSTAGMLLPAESEGFFSYVRIGDEVIKYTGITGNKLTGCQREALRSYDPRSFGVFHDLGESVETFYRFVGNAIDIPLKILNSGGSEYFVEGVKVGSIVEIDNGDPIPNSIFFEGVSVQDKYGVVIGDIFQVSSDLIPSNNVSGKIIGIGENSFGSYIITDQVLTVSIDTPAVVSFKSKYNVWPDGLGMGGDQVDTPQFESILETYNSSILPYDYFVKETINGKDFIDKRMLFPTGAFSIPRKGKISCGYSSPPLGNANIVKLTSQNTVNPQQNKLTRSVNKNFYNGIVFKFNQAVVDDKFISGDVTINNDSRQRIPVGSKPLVIEAHGLRPSDTTLDQIRILSSRILDKYKFGAEEINIGTFYGKTFNLDIGDVVLFGDDTLALPDTRYGQRGLTPRLMEIQNKTTAIKSGLNRLTLVDTAYSIGDASFGIVSPASEVGVGSTNTRIKIKNSFGLVAPLVEKTKWESFIGERVLVHAPDWSQEAETVLKGFDPSDSYLMAVDALPFVPSEGYIVEIINYPDNTNKEDAAVYKNVFVFTNPSVNIMFGISESEFTVSAGSIDKFNVGATITVRNEDYSIQSPEVKIDSIVGNNVILKSGLGFIPNSLFHVELLGFKDGGAPCRFI